MFLSTLLCHEYKIKIIDRVALFDNAEDSGSEQRDEYLHSREIFLKTFHYMQVIIDFNQSKCKK